ncbi:IS1/IS6 family transposase [Candidatus Micrarchaeota archaeon]|nr:IS1/IS6 family transposase [Candidatus Micrarchaeota archaeon]
MLSPLKCPCCKDNNIRKYGFRKTSERGKIQIYQCKNCSKNFSKNEGFKWKHKSEENILSCLALYGKGISIREAAEFLEVNKSTVLRWIQEYSTKLYLFLNKKVPLIAEKLHLDELFLKMRSSFCYIWDSIDYHTKFAVWFLSQSRSLEDAKLLLELSPNAKITVTDALASYKGAIRYTYSVLFYHAFHYPYKGFKDKWNNNPIERLQNTLRAWLHKKRGFHSLRTGNIMMNFYWVNYNFVRKHMTLRLTPAEKAGVISYPNWIKTEKEKWKYLIEKASFIFLKFLYSLFGILQS